METEEELRARTRVIVAAGVWHWRDGGGAPLCKKPLRDPEILQLKETKGAGCARCGEVLREIKKGW